jgi:hypothetical protein
MDQSARNALLSDGRTLPRESVYLEEIGVTVIVQGMTGKQRDEWESSLVKQKRNRREIDTRNVRARLVARCVINEDGSRMFSDDEADQLGDVRVDVLSKLFAVAQRLSGVTDEDVDELGKSSGATAGSGSRSN